MSNKHTPGPWLILPWNGDRNPEDFQIGTATDDRAVYRGGISINPNRLYATWTEGWKAGSLFALQAHINDILMHALRPELGSS